MHGFHLKREEYEVKSHILAFVIINFTLFQFISKLSVLCKDSWAATDE